MNSTLTDLLAAGLGIRTLVPADGEVAFAWAHASDLEDPTPFTEPGQLLLTTGRQFDDTWGETEYAAFVARLASAGIAAIGFGTEVIRDGTPRELVTACEIAAVPLLEIPYGTPFIAIGRWVADRQQAAARARLEWALSAQSAISSAAIGAGGIGDAIARAARLLDGRISLLDRKLVVLAGMSPSSGSELSPAVADTARRILRSRRRASVQIEEDERIVVLHTLGRGERLRGLLMAERRHGFDEAERSALTTLTALAEVSLEHIEDVRESVQALLSELLGLLRDGRTDIVRNAIAGLPAGLPDRRLHVVALDPEDVDEALLTSLAQQATDPSHKTFHAVHGERILFLVDVGRWQSVRAQLEISGSRAGLSDEVGWAALNAGVLQAVRALESAPAGALCTFEQVVSASVSGLLAESTVVEMAEARLAPVMERPEGARLLEDAAVWLARNAQWDPAARELGMHRHTLKARIGELGHLVGLDLQRFPARAELWTLLDALGIIAGGDVRRRKGAIWNAR